MFSCKDATKLMSDDREGTLQGWQAAQYRIHLTICMYCRRCKRQLERVIETAKDAGEGEGAVAPEVEEAAVAAFRARRKG